MRVSFLVDGFNLYHSLKDVGGLRWLNLVSFCKSYLPCIDRAATLDRVLYFSALVTHLQIRNPDALDRQRKFIRCLEDSGVEGILGKFKKIRMPPCRCCGYRGVRREEKQTDVAIAAHLIELLTSCTCDATVLVTGDTDLAPVVKVAQRMFPKKAVMFVFPLGRESQELERLVGVGRAFEVDGRKRYRRHQFPDPYRLRDGTSVAKPQAW